jgi:hypothetical protein
VPKAGTVNHLQAANARFNRLSLQPRKIIRRKT